MEKELTDFEQEGKAYFEAYEFLDWAWRDFRFTTLEYVADPEAAWEEFIHVHGYALPWYVWEVVLEILQGAKEMMS